MNEVAVPPELAQTETKRPFPAKVYTEAKQRELSNLSNGNASITAAEVDEQARLTAIREALPKLFQTPTVEEDHNKPTDNHVNKDTDSLQDVDTDDPEVRTKRIANQRELEEHMVDTYGLPFLQRIKKIREGIFKDIPNVRGEDINALRNIDMEFDSNIPSSHIENVFCNPDFMRERYLPEFSQMVDTVYSQIQNLEPSQRADAAIRLVSFLYTTNVVLHPYRDGNGQGGKLTALSYLHELVPEQFGDRYFPYKPKTIDKKNGSPSDETYDSVEEAEFKTKFMQNIDHAELFGYLPSNQAARLRRFDTAISRVEEIRDGKGTWGEHPYREQYLAQYTDEVNTLFPDETERSQLIAQRVEYLTRKATLEGSTFWQTNVHGYLEYTLNSGEGKQFITDYVLGSTNQPMNNYQQIARSAMEGIGTDMTAKLTTETKDVHTQKYSDAVLMAMK